MGQGGEIRRPQAGLTQSLTFHNRPLRERGPLHAEAHSPLVSRSLRNGAARKRIGDVRNCKSGATHRSIVFAAAIRPCTYKSAMSG